MSRARDHAPPRAVYESVQDYIRQTCPRFSEPQRRDEGRQFVYFIGTADGPVKIGLTRDVRQRLESLQTGSPVKLEILAYCEGDRWLERQYHTFFATQRLHGEWFGRGDNLLDQEIRIINAAHKRAVSHRAQRGTIESQNRAHFVRVVFA